MNDDTILSFSFPAVAYKKITAAFDGGRLTSDGGVMLLAMAEQRLGIAERLARLFPDSRDPVRVTHTLADMIRARVFAIAQGYGDDDDLDHLRSDPAFKLACGRLPDTGRDLCSQSTLSRLENAPWLKEVIRLTYALVDTWMDSYPRPPRSITLDIDDTCDVVHGHRVLLSRPALSESSGYKLLEPFETVGASRRFNSTFVGRYQPDVPTLTIDQRA